MPNALATVVSGELITSEWGNLVKKLVVPSYASAAARSSGLPAPDEGQLSILVDEDALDLHDGTAWRRLGLYGAWNTSTGAVSYSGTSSVSSTLRWRRLFGSTIEWECDWSITGGCTGTPRLVLPVALANTGGGAYVHVGTATWLDNGTGRQVFDVLLNSDLGSTTCELNYTRGNYTNVVTNTAPAAVAVGDVFHANGRYRAAVG